MTKHLMKSWSLFLQQVWTAQPLLPCTHVYHATEAIEAMLQLQHVVDAPPAAALKYGASLQYDLGVCCHQVATVYQGLVSGIDIEQRKRDAE